MPGIRIDVNTSGAQANTDSLREELRRLGEQGKLTEREIKELSARLAAKEAELKKAATATRGMTSAMDALTTAAKYAASAFALYKISDYIRESALLAARYETLGVTMETFGRNAGYTAQQVNYVATALQKTGISMLEAREQTTNLIQANIDLSKATDLARIAQNAATSAGLNSSEAFSRLVYGIQTAQVEILRNMRLNVDFEAAYKRVAKELGKTTAQLTAHEKMQARVNETERAGIGIAGAYTFAMTTAGKALGSMVRYQEDLKLKLGEAFGPATKTIVDAMGDSMKRMQEIIERPEIQAALQNIANLLAGAIAKGMTFISNWLAAHGSELPTMASTAATRFASLARNIASSVTELSRFVTEMRKIPTPILYAAVAAGSVGLVTKSPWAAVSAAALAFGAGLAADDVEAERTAVKAAEDRAKREQEAFDARFGRQRKDADVTFGTVLPEGALEAEFLANGGKIDLTPSKAPPIADTVDDLTGGAKKLAESAASFLDNITAGIEQLRDSLTGGTQKESLRIDKWFEQQFDAISKAVAGAKGDVSAYKEAWVALWKAWPGLKILAVTKDTTAALRQQASILRDIADASDNPALKEQAGAREIEAWYAERAQQIKNLSLATEEESTLMGQLEQARSSKMVQSTRDAYESMSSVSQKYWDAEKALIEQKLSVVKENADDELAYKIYAAQQWDDFNRRKLESQANAPRNIGEAIQAVFALDSGSYKSAMGQLQDSWKTTAERMLSLSNDLSSGIAQGLGDALRGLASGDIKSFEDVWKSMLNRLLDSFISFLEDMLAEWLKKNVFGALLGGVSGGASDLFKFSGSTASPSGWLDNLESVARAIGKPPSLFQGSASSPTGGFNSSSTSALNYLDAAKNGASAGGGFATAASAASTLSTVLGVVGIVGGLAGLAMSLFGQEEKKKEPEEVWSGRSYMYAGGAMSGFKYTQMDDGSHKLDAIDPFELEQERREFKKTARDFNKSLKSLEINFDPNWTRSFSFMAPPVSDELASAVQHVMMQAAGAHALGGLTNTVGLFAEGLENLIEVVARLGEAFSLVVPTFGVLGVDMKKMSASSDAVILSYAALATGFNEGVALIGDAVANQADSAEELSAQFIALGEAGKQTVDYFETYRKQLTNLALAQYSELLIDAVGGEDAFKSATTTFSEYAMGDKERAESSIKYYTTKFGEGRDDIDFMLPNFEIEWMGDSVDAFWKAYSSAMQQSMPPSMFTVWTDVAANVAGLEDALQALADVEFASWAWDEELKYRRQVVDEQKTGAEITRWSIQLEQELADARKNGATYAQQAALVETQIYEMQAKLNELLGQAKDESSDYGTALADLQEAISWQIEWTSKLASEALAASGAFKSFGESLRDTIDSINADALLPNLEYAKYRTQMSGLFKAAMSGTDADAQESMGKLGDVATSLLDAASRALSYQEYDALKARTVSQLSRAAAFSERQAEYQGVAGDMYTAQGGLLERMLAESKSTAPDAAFIENANGLLSLMAGISDAAKAVADGGMSADAFKTLAGQAESSIMQTDLLDRLLGGTLDMAGVSQSQAQLLLSSVDALAALSDYTGRDVDLSDQMRQQLEIIAAGVTPQDQWGSLITTIQNGQAEYVEWLKTNIASRREEADRLYALQQVENEAAGQMNTYFQAMAEYLEKQTNMETIAASIATLQSKAASYQNLAMTAMMTGGAVGMIMAMQHLQSAAAVAEQIAALSAQLSYWANLEVEIPALASGGIATAPTLAMIGEGGEPEVIAPLGDLMSPLHEFRQEMAALRRENRELQKQIVENTARTRGDTKELLRQSVKQTTILLRQEEAA